MLLAKSWFVKAVLVENESDYRIILLQRKTFIVQCQLKKHNFGHKFWSQRLIVHFNFHTLHRKQKTSVWCFYSLEPPLKFAQNRFPC